jgi:hypothetical protein
MLCMVDSKNVRQMYLDNTLHSFKLYCMTLRAAVMVREDPSVQLEATAGYTYSTVTHMYTQCLHSRDLPAPRAKSAL